MVCVHRSKFGRFSFFAACQSFLVPFVQNLTHTDNSENSAQNGQDKLENFAVAGKEGTKTLETEALRNQLVPVGALLFGDAVTSAVLSTAFEQSHKSRLNLATNSN